MAATKKAKKTSTRPKASGQPVRQGASYYNKKKDNSRFRKRGGMSLIHALAGAIADKGGVVPESQAKRFVKDIAAQREKKPNDAMFLSQTIFSQGVGQGYLRSEGGLVKLTRKGSALLDPVLAQEQRASPELVGP